MKHIKRHGFEQADPLTAQHELKDYPFSTYLALTKGPHIFCVSVYVTSLDWANGAVCCCVT